MAIEESTTGGWNSYAAIPRSNVEQRFRHGGSRTKRTKASALRRPIAGVQHARRRQSRTAHRNKLLNGIRDGHPTALATLQRLAASELYRDEVKQRFWGGRLHGWSRAKQIKAMHSGPVLCGEPSRCAMRPCSDAKNRGLRCACLSRTRDKMTQSRCPVYTRTTGLVVESD